MRTLSHGHHAPDASGIDLAPMLDFVVNLLIFFIVTAVFVRQAGVEVARPKPPQDGTVNPSKSIVIAENGEISIDGDTVDLRAVRAHIEQFRAVDATGGVVVVAAEHAATGVVVAVVDEVHLGGIHDITFSTAR